jgi:hypothetical protein
LHLNRFYLDATPLPQMGAAAIQTLAAFSLEQLSERPRFRSLPAKETRQVKTAGSSLQVTPWVAEALIARGYGLEADHLRLMFRPSEADRKGLWRYFRAVPEALDVAARSIEELEAA